MRKVLFRIGIITIGSIIAVLIAVGVLLHTPPARNFIQGQAREYVRRNLDSELTIDGFRYNFLRGVVSFDGLIIRSDAAPDSKPFLKIGRGSIDFDPGATLLGRASVNSARLEDVDIHIVVEQDGGTNLPKLEGRGDGAGVLIDSVDVQKGSIRIEDARQQIELSLPSWELQMQDSSDISLQTHESGILKYKGNEFDIRDLALESELGTDALKIEKLNLIAAGSKAQGSGIIRDLSDPVVDVKFDADIDLTEAAALAGLTGDIQGRAEGTIVVTGPPRSLHIKGTLGVNSAGPR